MTRLALAKLTSAVSSRRTGLPGHGLAEILEIKDGRLVPSGITVTVYSVSSSSVRRGTSVVLAEIQPGSWFITSADA